jgi:hypothetical protein
MRHIVAITLVHELVTRVVEKLNGNIGDQNKFDTSVINQITSNKKEG